MGNQYGSYVMYFLSNLLQKQNRKERYKEFGLFENDETGSEWHRQETLELLKNSARKVMKMLANTDISS